MGAQVVEIKEKRQRRPVSRVTVLTEKAAPGPVLATRWFLSSPSSCKQVVPPFGLIVRSARSRSAFATLGPEIPLTTSRSASRRTSCWAERISAFRPQEQRGIGCRSEQVVEIGHRDLIASISEQAGNRVRPQRAG